MPETARDLLGQIVSGVRGEIHVEQEGAAAQFTGNSGAWVYVTRVGRNNFVVEACREHMASVHQDRLQPGGDVDAVVQRARRYMGW